MPHPIKRSWYDDTVKWELRYHDSFAVEIPPFATYHVAFVINYEYVRELYLKTNISEKIRFRTRVMQNPNSCSDRCSRDMGEVSSIRHHCLTKL